jgi:hypothetical protein
MSASCNHGSPDQGEMILLPDSLVKEGVIT